jgi:hypothetical protein
MTPNQKKAKLAGVLIKLRDWLNVEVDKFDDQKGPNDAQVTAFAAFVVDVTETLFDRGET